MGKLKKGLLITFEGGEGCGKSTHVKLLAKYLSNKGHHVVKTFEPGATKIGRIIRNILLKDQDKLAKESEILLFAVDRVEHIQKVVKPALDSKKIVISDRYMDSTTAYQRGGRGLSKELVEFINIQSSFGVIPDLTIILDISYNEGINRISRRPNTDKFEQENRSFHDRVRKAYANIAKNNPKRVKIVSSNGSIYSVQNEIRVIIDKFMVKYEK